MKHSTKYEAKVGIERLPITENETMVLQDFHYREILEDQSGEKYFLNKNDRAIYFDTIALPQPKDESQKELFTGESWKVDETGGIIEPFDIISNNGKLISSVKWGTKQTAPETFEEVKANAYLQAASPDMYRALKKIHDECHKILLRGTEVMLTREELKTFIGAVAETTQPAIKKATPNK